MLAAAGYNFRLLVLWLSLLRAWLAAIMRTKPPPSTSRQVA
ncbi:hypothetical protein HNR60_000713 [Rhodopseudomonas rhenobacensis]|uniref:Uncharacterized protein n=1 Tax=Rhodopseudomonas rhenobacensis TaxID=87461 RepID=A0A7W8DXK2_9BRAD|nr:hypothetical protein [Rhodopseudomonas rhenobacensis]